MAKAIPNPESPRSGDSVRRPIPKPGNHPSGLEPWSAEELLDRDQLNVSPTRAQIDTGLNHKLPDPKLVQQIRDLEAENAELQKIVEELQQHLEAAGDSSEQEKLESENTELRHIIADLKEQMANASSTENEDAGSAERLKEYEGLLDEKTELIRELHLKLQEHQSAVKAPATPKEEELLAMSEELERERCQIQQERRGLDDELRQLKDDGDVMTEEMRKMEMQMSRERAELARQRAELTRINEEIRHELERAERDGGLNDRLEQLRQRHQEVMKGKSAPPSTPGNRRQAPPPTQLSIDLDSDEGGRAQNDKKKDSGGLRRFFKQ